MNKQLVIAISMLLCGLIFFSCKKTYECSCHTASGAHEHMDIKVKKADAESECKAKAVGTYTACELE
ncbi:MAG: hypothetical protein ACK50A_11330 [Sphingobacteriaceae bacterium]|jgi:hypothetical protein